MRTRVGSWVLCAALVGFGCDDGSAVDAGGGTDAGPRIDAGRTDAGPGATDAGNDAGGGSDAGLADSGIDGGDPCDGVDCTSLDDACNVGTCDPTTGSCMAVPVTDGTACDDEDLCTTSDVCAGGACGGTAMDCSSMDAMCALGVCDATSGSCIAMPVADATACDDGFACTSMSECASGMCVGSGLACTSVQADLTMTSLTTSVGGGGGSAVMGRCPSGQVLTGFQGEIETGNLLPDRPGATEGICSTIAIDSSGVITTVEQGTIGPFAAGDDPPPRTTWARRCPTDQVVVGYAAEATTYVIALTFRCAPLSLGAADAGYPVLVGAGTDLVPVGTSSGAAAGPYDCGAGEAAVGVDGRAGAWIDSWSLECAPLDGRP
ncbi:MAG: hypothetical protein AB7S26_31965 [Sandaracinaceae bacterium]